MPLSEATIRNPKTKTAWNLKSAVRRADNPTGGTNVSYRFCAGISHVSSAQADIDSLLAQAESLATEALGSDPAGSAAPAAEAPPKPSESPAPATPAAQTGSAGRPDVGHDPRSEPLQRIMRIEVPVIVKLAECRMPLARIVGLNTGAIIEFEKPADANLDLMINNKCIGLGQAVKVGENFGLRITQVGTLLEKIEALGG